MQRVYPVCTTTLRPRRGHEPVRRRGYAAEEGMGYRDILKHYYSGVSIRTVGSGTSSGGGLFGWLRRLLGM